MTINTGRRSAAGVFLTMGRLEVEYWNIVSVRERTLLWREVELMKQLGTVGLSRLREHVKFATVSLTVGLLLFTGLLNCRAANEGSDGGDINKIIKVSDDTGYRLELKKVPARIISIAPNVTEILFAIKADDKLVAVTDICNFPEAAKSKPTIGDFVSPSLERIIAFEPDLVIGCGTLHPVLGRLRELGVPVLSFNPSTLDELFVMIEKTGKAMGREENARELSASLRNEVEVVRSRVAQVKSANRVKVFVELWHDPLMTVGAGSFVNDLVENAGAVNVGASIGTGYFEVSHERVLDANPQVIVAAYMEKGTSARNLIMSRETWRSVSAVASGRVFDDIDPDLLLRPSVRAVHTVRALAERFYPELFGKTTR